MERRARTRVLVLLVLVQYSLGQYQDYNYNSINGNNGLGQYNSLNGNIGNYNNFRPNQPYYNPVPVPADQYYRPTGLIDNVPTIVSRPTIQPVRVEVECYLPNSNQRNQDIRWLVQPPGALNGNLKLIAQGTASSNPNYAVTLTQIDNKWVSRLVIGTGSIPAQQLMGSYLCQYPDPLRPYNYVTSDILVLDYRPYINSQPPYGHPDPYASPYLMSGGRNNKQDLPRPQTPFMEVMDAKAAEVPDIAIQTVESTDKN